MKIPAIKKAGGKPLPEDPRAAEAALYDELELLIDIEGPDEGEKLTHILAAIAILKTCSRTIPSLRMRAAGGTNACAIPLIRQGAGGNSAKKLGMTGAAQIP